MPSSWAKRSTAMECGLEPRSELRGEEVHDGWRKMTTRGTVTSGGRWPQPSVSDWILSPLGSHRNGRSWPSRSWSALPAWSECKDGPDSKSAASIASPAASRSSAGKTKGFPSASASASAVAGMRMTFMCVGVLPELELGGLIERNQILCEGHLPFRSLNAQHVRNMFWTLKSDKTTATNAF